MDELIVWDEDEGLEGNGSHVAENDLTRDDVEDVLRDESFAVHAYSRSSGHNATFGYTPAGEHIVVFWREDNDDPRVVYPVTAYRVPPRSRR